MLPDLPPAPPPTLNQVQELTVRSAPGGVSAERLKEIGAVRAAALREVALGAGARAGLEARNYEIQQVLRKSETQLDAIFNFRSLLLDSNVLPPVLLEGENLYSQESGESLRIVDQVYKIHAQARFVSVPPTWRDYLYKEYPGRELPHHSLLPQNGAEQDAWKVWVAEGWANGVSQADTLYADNLNRLRRDYEGMVKYRVLHAQGMVSRPYVAQSHFGVTGDSENLNVNETTLRITALPVFNLEPKRWNTTAAPEAKALFARQPILDTTAARPAIAREPVSSVPEPKAKSPKKKSKSKKSEPTP